MTATKWTFLKNPKHRDQINVMAAPKNPNEPPSEKTSKWRTKMLTAGIALTPWMSEIRNPIAAQLPESTTHITHDTGDGNTAGDPGISFAEFVKNADKESTAVVEVEWPLVSSLHMYKADEEKSTLSKIMLNNVKTKKKEKPDRFFLAVMRLPITNPPIFKDGILCIKVPKNKWVTLDDKLQDFSRELKKKMEDEIFPIGVLDIPCDEDALLSPIEKEARRLQITAEAVRKKLRMTPMMDAGLTKDELGLLQKASILVFAAESVRKQSSQNKSSTDGDIQSRLTTDFDELVIIERGSDSPFGNENFKPIETFFDERINTGLNQANKDALAKMKEKFKPNMCVVNKSFFENIRLDARQDDPWVKLLVKYRNIFRDYMVDFDKVKSEIPKDATHFEERAKSVLEGSREGKFNIWCYDMPVQQNLPSDTGKKR